MPTACVKHWIDLLSDELEYPRLTAALTDEIWAIAHSEGSDNAKKRKIAHLIDELWRHKTPSIQPSDILTSSTDQPIPPFKLLPLVSPPTLSPTIDQPIPQFKPL